MLLETLIAHEDIQEARERNRRKKEKGEEMKKVYTEAKSLTAMYHFNEHGCKVRMDALQKKRHLQSIQDDKVREALKKDVEAWERKKDKFEKVMEKNVPEDKLTGEQLKVLLTFKRQPQDKPFHSLWKKELVKLWKEWKHRPNIEKPTSDEAMVMSITAASLDTTVTMEIESDIEEIEVMAELV